MMNKIAELAEQYLYESELHLARLDALIARAAGVPGDGEAPVEAVALVKRMKRDRDRLAAELDGLRQFPEDAEAHSVENPNGVFQAVGLQLEKALGAVLEHGRRKHSAVD